MRCRRVGLGGLGGAGAGHHGGARAGGPAALSVYGEAELLSEATALLDEMCKAVGRASPLARTLLEIDRRLLARELAEKRVQRRHVVRSLLNLMLSLSQRCLRLILLGFGSEQPSFSKCQLRASLLRCL